MYVGRYSWNSDEPEGLGNYDREELERMYRRLSRDYRSGDVPKESEMEHLQAMFGVERALRQADVDPGIIAREVDEEIEDWEEEWN